MEYKDKLRRIQWQKLRLKVFERDEWVCQECYAGEAQGVSLHVHHTFYRKNADPWDHPLESLVTLCDECHKKETNEARWSAENDLLLALRERGASTTILKHLTWSLRNADLVQRTEMTLFNLAWVLDHPDLQKLVADLVAEKL